MIIFGCWFFQDTNYCNINPCDDNLPNGDSLGRTITFDINNCHAMNVSDVSTERVDIRMDIYNSAGLSISRSVQVIHVHSRMSDFYPWCIFVSFPQRIS